MDTSTHKAAAHGAAFGRRMDRERLHSQVPQRTDWRLWMETLWIDGARSAPIRSSGPHVGLQCSRTIRVFGRGRTRARHTKDACTSGAWRAAFGRRMDRATIHSQAPQHSHGACGWIVARSMGREAPPCAAVDHPCGPLSLCTLCDWLFVCACARQMFAGKQRPQRAWTPDIARGPRPGLQSLRAFTGRLQSAERAAPTCYVCSQSAAPTFFSP
jgi:hypothetical protein